CRAPLGRGKGARGRRRRRGASERTPRAPVEGRRSRRAAESERASDGRVMSGSAYANLRLEKDGPVLHILLNRPEVRNAFDDVLIEELTRAFHAAAVEPGTRAVVLSGEGPTFCAGADISWMRKAGGYTKDENEADAERMAQMLRAIDTCPRPVIVL